MTKLVLGEPSQLIDAPRAYRGRVECDHARIFGTRRFGKVRPWEADVDEPRWTALLNAQRNASVAPNGRSRPRNRHSVRAKKVRWVEHEAIIVRRAPGQDQSNENPSHNRLHEV